jgi:ubiquitin-like 1-activating enzyme E1 A
MENTATSVPDGISEDEIALYDRQIRLWGMKAQEKIRGANILLITIKALANEIAKNLVLAGIGSLTLLDDETVKEVDLGAQFLLSEVDQATVIGRNRAEAASHFLKRLNPRVQIIADSEGIKAKGTSYFESFDVVIATDLDPNTLNIVNTATRLHGHAFYAAGTHGMYGYIFCDLIEHDFIEKREVSNVTVKVGPETRTRSVINVMTSKEGDKTVEAITRREVYSTWFLASDAAGLPQRYHDSKRLLKGVTPVLSCLRALWEFTEETGHYPGRDSHDDLKRFTTLASMKHKALHLPTETLTSSVLRQFLQNVGSEISPSTSILGGQLAQDVINVLGQSQQPIQNMVIFDGEALTADMYTLHPEGELGKKLLSDVTIDASLLVPNGEAPVV